MKELETNFSFSYDYLMFKVGDVVEFMNRDSTEFAGRGVTQVDIDAFETQGNDFEAFSPDSFYQMFVTQEVEVKNAARADCALQARKMAAIVEQVYGNKSGVYKGLRYGNVANAKDDSFITLMRNIAKVCETFLANMSSSGMSQTLIDNLRAEAQIMEDKFHAISIKEAERDDATEERITLANDLYNNLSKYCQIGKSIWEDVSESKYNDYVINPKVNHGLAKVQNLVITSDPITPENITLTWDPVVDATEYEIYQSQVAGGDPAGEYEINQATPNVTEAITIVAGFRYYYKVRAKNATKVGDFSNQEWIEI
jgi:hypothetical protein